MNPNLYPNGTPFEAIELVEKNIDKLIIRKNEKKPVFIIIDGSSSTGKTTIGTHLGDMINKKHGLGEIALTKDSPQLGTGSEDFINKLIPAGKKGLPVIMFDEGGEYNRRGWASRLNKIMDKVIDTFRAYNIIIIFILHDFTELPKHVWNVKIATALIHLKERKGLHYGRSYWYDLKSMYYIIHHRTKDVFPEESYDKVYPNFRTKFKDLSPERSHQLDILSTAHKQSSIENQQILLEGLSNYNQLSLQIGKSEAWVRKKVRELKIRPQRIHKKKNYYSQEAISRLETEIYKSV